MAFEIGSSRIIPCFRDFTLVVLRGLKQEPLSFSSQEAHRDMGLSCCFQGPPESVLLCKRAPGPHYCTPLLRRPQQLRLEGSTPLSLLARSRLSFPRWDGNVLSWWLFARVWCFPIYHLSSIDPSVFIYLGLGSSFSPSFPFPFPPSFPLLII